MAQRAAVEGNSEAQYLLGKMYRHGYGVVQNKSVGDSLLEKSAAQGHESAIKLLHFLEGVGFQVEETFYQTLPGVQKLAEDGDIESQYQLAIRYEAGTYGVDKDNQKALYWFNKAANNGHVLAMKSLGHIYQNGLDGVMADSQRAQYWYEKAARTN